MQLLLARIPKRATATYGEIARMLQRELGFGKNKIFPVHIGAVAGELMDLILDKYGDAPLINLLIVAEGGGLPSEGCYGYIERRRPPRFCILVAAIVRGNSLSNLESDDPKGKPSRKTLG